MGRLATADWSATAGSGLTGYLWQIQRFPMLERHEEYRLAKRWRGHGDHEAAHKLVNSHLRLVAKIARGYRGYGLPMSDVISEGNVGLMQAVQRFDPEKGFRVATYAVWWIRAAIQEYILRSWSLVKISTTTNQKKLFFNLRKAKSKICALDEGDMRHDQVETIAKRLSVTEQDVVDMNCRLGGDASLNVSIREDGESSEWQDWLVDEGASQEATLAASDELDDRRKTLASALCVLNDRERRIFEAHRLAEEPDHACGFGRRVRRLARARSPDRREFVREGAEGGDEPRRGDGDPDTSASALASNPHPWWEKLAHRAHLPVRRTEGRHGRGSVAQLHHQFRAAAPGGARRAASCARARWRGCAARRSSYWASPSRHREADRAQDLPAGATLFRPARLRRADESGTCLLPGSREATWHRRCPSAVSSFVCSIARSVACSRICSM